MNRGADTAADARIEALCGVAGAGTAADLPLGSCRNEGARRMIDNGDILCSVAVTGRTSAGSGLVGTKEQHMRLPPKKPVTATLHNEKLAAVVTFLFSLFSIDSHVNVAHSSLQLVYIVMLQFYVHISGIISADLRFS